MRVTLRQMLIAVLAMGCVVSGSTGCALGPQPVIEPAIQKNTTVHAMIDMMKLLDLHPARIKLRQMEQALNVMDAKASDQSAAMETAQHELEVVMKTRQNEDQAALTQQQMQMETKMNEQRRLFMDELENEYRMPLFNIDLKLQTIQLSPTERQALQKERDRLTAERQRKLAAKDVELTSRLNAEMTALASDLSGRADAYAQKWMEDRRQNLQKPIESPERESLRREIVELSGRMIQDIRLAVTNIAVQEKIDMVWLKPAMHKSVKDITDAVAREIANAK